MAKRYDELPVEKWNTTHFRDYLSDLHEEQFGITYQPGGGGWRAEAGLMGTLIGTAKKKGLYDKAVIKEFLRRGIITYNPTSQWPGTNLMFLWSFRKNILQQIETELKQESEAIEPDDIDKGGLDDWL